MSGRTWRRNHGPLHPTGEDGELFQCVCCFIMNSRKDFRRRIVRAEDYQHDGEPHRIVLQPERMACRRPPQSPLLIAEQVLPLVPLRPDRTSRRKGAPAVSIPDCGLASCRASRPSHFRGFFLAGLRRRTPGPPPSASMNVTPAASIAARIFSIVSSRPPSSPSTEFEPSHSRF